MLRLSKTIQPNCLSGWVLIRMGEVRLVFQKFCYIRVAKDKIQRTFQQGDWKMFFVISRLCYESVFFIMGMYCTSENNARD